MFAFARFTLLPCTVPPGGQILSSNCFRQASSVSNAIRQLILSRQGPIVSDSVRRSGQGTGPKGTSCPTNRRFSPARGLAQKKLRSQIERGSLMEPLEGGLAVFLTHVPNTWQRCVMSFGRSCLLFCVIACMSASNTLTCHWSIHGIYMLNTCSMSDAVQGRRRIRMSEMRILPSKSGANGREKGGHQ